MMLTIVLSASIEYDRKCVHAQECILLFEQYIKVDEDGKLTVKENIHVVAKGYSIKRGIYREFPIEYVDERGNIHRVGFKVLEILKDGKPESWFSKREDGNIRIYIGKRDVYLEPGTYIYTIVYETDRQIGFFKEHDELYWNVNGTGWKLPIQKVHAIVELPKGIPKEKVRTTAYTGAYGETGKDFVSWTDEQGRIHFATTRILGEGENLTIVVGFPKGYVKQAGFFTQVWLFFRDNKEMLFVWIVALLSMLAYGILWLFVGRDPKKGTIVPRFKPPEGMSPAGVRYVYRLGYDTDCLVSNIISACVKGVLCIRGNILEYEILRCGEAKLTKDEKATVDLISGVTVGRQSEDIYSVQLANELTHRRLREAYGKLFRRNIPFSISVLAIALLLVFLVSLRDPSLALQGIQDAWLLALGSSLFIIGLPASLYIFTKFIARRIGKGSTLLPILGLLVGSALSLLFAYYFARDNNAHVVSLSFALLIIMLAFLWSLKYLPAYTPKGRRIADHIEGFRMFLETAEKDRLRTLFPEDDYPKIFERFLPYAFALDVVDTWFEKFSDILERMQYRPRWHDVRGMHSFRHFHREFSRHISESLSGSMRRRTGSSGFGRGGFSGGGGGGGGGGGW